VTPGTRKLALAAAITSALLTAAFFARRSLGIEMNPLSIRDFVHELGPIGPAIFVALIAFRSLLGLPSQVVLVAAGLCFGLIAGTIYGAIGLTLSGVAFFQIARWTGRETVMTRMPDVWRRAFDGAGTGMGAALVGLGTSYPVGPITAYHALAGVTEMTLLHFVAAVILGGAIRAAIFVFFGDSLVRDGVSGLVWPTLIITAVAVLPLVFPPTRRRIRELMGRSGS